uniref:APC membrane recruitment protein 2-like n=1 Tax=Mastacembelus armatus TaxID=205130 RepID=A0A3Q3MGT1_9TELE
MDVQTENMDPAPCESQPTGKIRKGFKLFGKRKPGNIFSIRAKGDGNNKSPVMRSKTLDGLSETTAPDSEQEPDKENGHEVSQREREQAEEEQLGEDGVLAAAPARNSISSASSAKSLSFLSLLRGGRRGVGDRRVHTVSQPVGRRRRGLKGLFDNVKFRSKDKEDKEEAPPSPLLMTSRANSVEIIKEDLTLTPKSQPRSLDSPGSESYEPVKSSTAQDSSDTSTSETQIPQVTAGNVSRTNEHVPHLSTSEAPLVPGDTSLSSLLADISSLLTFDSISGGGDIMADVEAEWGKASNAISAVVTEVSPSSTALFSKPTFSSPQTSTSISTTLTAKSSPVVVPKTIPVSQSKVPPGPSPVTSPLSTPAPFHPAEVPASTKRTPQAKGSGLSKIPVVGGGRAGKLPVRDSQQVDDEASRDPPTPVLEEEKPHLNSHDAWNKDKISDVDSNVPTSKHTLEESQQPLQQKVLTSLPRDSKIPVKHSAQSHTASQIPQAKEPPRTKIPVSKVPVRRAGNKPAASGGSTQTRK